MKKIVGRFFLIIQLTVFFPVFVAGFLWPIIKGVFELGEEISENL